MMGGVSHGLDSPVARGLQGFERIAMGGGGSTLIVIPQSGADLK
jgi:hypothetical protein